MGERKRREGKGGEREWSGKVERGRVSVEGGREGGGRGGGERVFVCLCFGGVLGLCVCLVFVGWVFDGWLCGWGEREWSGAGQVARNVIWGGTWRLCLLGDTGHLLQVLGHPSPFQFP